MGKRVAHPTEFQEDDMRRYVFVIEVLVLSMFAVAVASEANMPAVSSPTANNNTPSDIAKLKKAADAGDANSQGKLGYCYDQGIGVEKDYKEAVKWYRKAAEQGVAEAQHSLGACYYNGNDVGQDYKEAAKWCRKAAEQGIDEAQNDLGVYYANGQGVVKNYVEAYKWYLIAGANGFDVGKNKKMIAKKMTQDQIAEAEKRAKEFLNQSKKAE